MYVYMYAYIYIYIYITLHMMSLLGWLRLGLALNALT